MAFNIILKVFAIIDLLWSLIMSSVFIFLTAKNTCNAEDEYKSHKLVALCITVCVQVLMEIFVTCLAHRAISQRNIEKLFKWALFRFLILPVITWTEWGVSAFADKIVVDSIISAAFICAVVYYFFELLTAYMIQKGFKTSSV